MMHRGAAYSMVSSIWRCGMTMLNMYIAKQPAYSVSSRKHVGFACWQMAG